MRIPALAAVALLLAAPTWAQNVSAELQTLHQQWLDAFDRGEATTMHRMEVDDVVYVLPDASVVYKTGSPAWSPRRVNGSQRRLHAVTVRQFGDTAIMTGLLFTTDDSADEATTVVWVKRDDGWRIASVQWTPVQKK